ncbi:hypothetical protein ABFB10_00510 [Ponticoccus litoralis]|uniref:Uncharacterized protein n=1 Tax=Ponticoccus litoralis TaxID=422297 RepID=A0AAW9S735_9RHOB
MDLDAPVEILDLAAPFGKGELAQSGQAVLPIGLEQRRAQMILQLLERHGDRRGGAAKPLYRIVQIAQLGHGDKIPQHLDLDGHTSTFL